MPPTGTPYRSRVEMYLEATRDQHFTVGGENFVLREHENIHMENSHKFTVATFQDLALKAGLMSRPVLGGKGSALFHALARTLTAIRDFRIYMDDREV